MVSQKLIEMEENTVKKPPSHHVKAKTFGGNLQPGSWISNPSCCQHSCSEAWKIPWLVDWVLDERWLSRHGLCQSICHIYTKIWQEDVYILKRWLRSTLARLQME